MPLRTITECKNLNNRRWCEYGNFDSAWSTPSFAITCRRPAQQAFSANRPGTAVKFDHRSVRQVANRHWMFAFEVAVEAFRVQNAIHLGSVRPSMRIRRIGPQSGKGLRILSSAFEARPVTGGKRGYFVEKEKLGIVFPPHVAATSVR